jgi:hypothetical protein
MEFNSRKSVNDKLKKYDYLAKDEDYIEVTEWANGEGYDITIYGESNYKQFSLTDGELEAIKYLTKSLEIQ